jgi:hypothetical protein
MTVETIEAARLPAVAAISAAAASTTPTAAAPSAAATTATTAPSVPAAASPSAATTGARRALFGFVDAERAPVEWAAVHRLDRVLCLLLGPHRHEAEASRLPRHAVCHDMYIGDLTDLRERRTHRLDRRIERQIANVKTRSHHPISL